LDRAEKEKPPAATTIWHARSSDTAGVILLGLPVSSLSGGNQASNIARLKAEIEAIQEQGPLKNCSLPPPPPPIEPPGKNAQTRKPGPGTSG